MFNDENADLCESRWSVFLFFFRWKGEKKKERKEKFVLREIKGIKKKKKNEGTRDDRAMIESERTSMAISQCLPRSREDRERKGRGKK